MMDYHKSFFFVCNFSTLGEEHLRCALLLSDLSRARSILFLMIKKYN